MGPHTPQQELLGTFLLGQQQWPEGAAEGYWAPLRGRWTVAMAGRDVGLGEATRWRARVQHLPWSPVDGLRPPRWNLISAKQSPSLEGPSPPQRSFLPAESYLRPWKRLVPSEDESAFPSEDFTPHRKVWFSPLEKSGALRRGWSPLGIWISS